MKKEKYFVDIIDENLRLDVFLTKSTDLSRSNIKKLIDDGKVFVNGLNIKSSYKVIFNDEIEIMYDEPKEIKILPKKIDIDIIYEDDDILVINKQKGLVVHPGSGNYDNTLVNALLYYCKDLSGINGYLRPGIVHRIDKDTSGLLVVAKNDKAHVFLSQQLKDKTCFRKYYTILSGVIEYDNFSVDAPIGRSSKDRQKMAVTEKNSKNAITHFKVLKRFSKFTFCEAQLETGRTHQIRVHANYIKHPVYNDPKYGNNLVDQNGQLLHAYYLSFIHPKTLERLEFSTKIPDYFYDYLLKGENFE